MRRFSTAIEDLGLRDLPLQGDHFTRSGGHDNCAKSRLDRFLVSSDWENCFSGVVQCILPRPVSDHFLIFLDGGGISFGPTPFRFENMWLKAEGFKELLKSWWQDLSFCGTHSYILAVKLKALKGLLKSCNKEVFDEVESRKSKALRRVTFWDDKENDRVLNMEEVEDRAAAKEDFKKWCLLEESWRQKSWELWLK